MKKGSLVIWLIVLATVLYVLAPLFQRDTREGFAIQKFGRFPVLTENKLSPRSTKRSRRWIG